MFTLESFLNFDGKEFRFNRQNLEKSPAASWKGSRKANRKNAGNIVSAVNETLLFDMSEWYANLHNVTKHLMPPFSIIYVNFQRATKECIRFLLTCHYQLFKCVFCHELIAVLTVAICQSRETDEQIPDERIKWNN